MSGHKKWSKLRDELMAKPRAAEAMERARAESEEEIRLYELRHAETISQAELAGRVRRALLAWMAKLAKGGSLNACRP